MLINYTFLLSYLLALCYLDLRYLYVVDICLKYHLLFQSGQLVQHEKKVLNFIT